MSDKVLRPAPPPLPATLQDWQKVNKMPRTINDDVQDVHIALLGAENENERDQYKALLDAVWDDDTVEGSMAADNLFAAAMIRSAALKADEKHPLAHKKAATIAKALKVVLRRYGQGRSQRRDMIDGEVVPPDSTGND